MRRLLLIVFVLAIAVVGFSSPARASVTDATHLSDVVIQPGGHHTRATLSWYSTSWRHQTLQWVVADDVVGGRFPASRAEAKPHRSGLSADVRRVFRHATMSGLRPGQTYLWRVGNDRDGWSAPRELRVDDTPNEHTFWVFGDPQIGSSGDRAADGAGWRASVAAAERRAPGADMAISVGDQVEIAASETEYTQFFSAPQVRQLPWLTVIGNHDVGTVNYRQHFEAAHRSGGGDLGWLGSDSWTRHGDVLIMALNSNDLFAHHHRKFMIDAIARNTDARWRIVVFHHSIYSIASHEDDADAELRRSEWPRMFSALGVDAVLMGHDHSYTRTFLMNDGRVVPGTGGPQVAAREGDVLYLTFNSASGSKFYGVHAGPFAYAAVKDQSRVPNYSVLDVDACRLSVATYQTTDEALVDQVELTGAHC